MMTVLTSRALTVAMLVTGAVARAPGATPAPGIGESLPCFTVPGCEAFYENLLGAIYADAAPVNISYGPVYSYEKCRRADAKGYQTCVYTATGSTKSFVPLFSLMTCEKKGMGHCLPELKFNLADLVELRNATSYCDRCLRDAPEDAASCEANVTHWMKKVDPTGIVDKTLAGLPFAVGRHCGDDDQPAAEAGPIVMLVVTLLLVVLAIAAETAEYFRANPVGGSLSGSLNTTSPMESAGLLGTSKLEKRGRHGTALSAFLPSKNLGELFSKSPARSLGGLDGMRSFSMLWIILGHSSLFTTFEGEVNPATSKDVLQSLPEQFVYSAAFGVDTFFFISGMLTAYTMMNKLRKKIKPVAQLPQQTLLFMLLRWLRLTPVFAYVLFMYTFIGSTAASGPFWYRMVEETSYCHEYWWSNLLYINNFVPDEYHQMCMAWSWYLANDMQFFLVALLIMYVYVRSARAGGGLALALTLICTVISYVVVVPLNSAEYQNQFYEKPWTRLPPFTAGMLLGMILRDTDLKNRRFSRPIAAALMSLFIAGILFVFYIQYDRYSQAGYDNPLAKLNSRWSKYEFAAYNSFGRLFYIIALGGMCALNASGNGGFVFKFLALPFWEPMGKLTYGAYLIHPVILRVWYYSHVQYAQFSPIEQTMLFFAAAASSYACAVFTYCLIELPFDSLIKRALKI